MRKKLSKKAVIFNVTIVIMTVFLLTVAYVKLTDKYSDKEKGFEKFIGERQLETIQTYQSAEKALFYLDESAKLSAYGSIHNMGSFGGFSPLDNPLTFAGFSSWTYKKQNITPNLDKSMTFYMEQYLNNFSKNYSGIVEIPLDNYEIVVNGKTIEGYATKDMGGGGYFATPSIKFTTFPLSVSPYGRSSYYVVSCFGYRGSCPTTDPNGQCIGTSHHAGLDLRARRGDKVIAVGDGIVKSIDSSWGQVNIEHSGGVQSMYMHMDTISTALIVGKPVEEGDIIGTVGGRGPSGPDAYNDHLHFAIIDPSVSKEMQIRGYVNPLPYLGGLTGVNFDFNPDSLSCQSQGARYSIKPNFNVKTEFDFSYYNDIRNIIETTKKQCGDDINCLSDATKNIMQEETNNPKYDWMIKYDLNIKTKDATAGVIEEDKWRENCENGYDLFFNDFIEKFQNCVEATNELCECNLTPSENFYISTSSFPTPQVPLTITIRFNGRDGKIEILNSSYVYENSHLSSQLGFFGDDLDIVQKKTYVDYVVTYDGSGKLTDYYVQDNVGTKYTDFFVYNATSKNFGISFIGADQNKEKCVSPKRSLKFCLIDKKRKYPINLEKGVEMKYPVLRFSYYIEDTTPPAQMDTSLAGYSVTDIPDAENAVTITFPKSPANDVAYYYIYTSKDDLIADVINDIPAKKIPVTDQNKATYTEDIIGFSSYDNYTHEQKVFVAIVAEDLSGNKNTNVKWFYGEEIDDFPPLPLENFKAVKNGNNVELFWDVQYSSTVKDLKKYMLYCSLDEPANIIEAEKGTKYANGGVSYTTTTTPKLTIRGDAPADPCASKTFFAIIANDEDILNKRLSITKIQ